MADAPTAEVGGQIAIVERSAGGDGALSALDAARSLVDARRKEQAGQQAQSEDGATPAAEESPPQGDDTAQETGPGETQEGDAEAEQLPPIDPPRSWTKEDKELWKGLPRDTQERLADRERSRDKEFSNRLNETDAKTKALTAKEAAAEKVRADYEQALPMLLTEIQNQHQGQFADIKSIADVERMAAEDWPRYVLWDAQQKKIAAVQQQVQVAEQRQATEKAQKWQTFASDEDAKFAEKAPELASSDAKDKAAKGAAAMLKELGFTDGELGDLWSGKSEISLRDHRVQLLIRDGVRYREAQAKATASKQKPVPSVQRPGTPQPRGAAQDERVKVLDQRLNQSGNVKDAAALLAARRKAG